MNFDPRKQRRRTIRLKGYDYAQAGAYFVTIVTRNRACEFGEIVNTEMQLNDSGRIIQKVWDELPNHYGGVKCDAFIIMPNPVHGIIVLHGLSVQGAGLKPAPCTQPAANRGLAEIVRGFKTFSARRIHDLRKIRENSLWQRNYFEHVIRNEESLLRIRQYILENPARWEFDRENPSATSPESKASWRNGPKGRPPVAPTRNNPVPALMPVIPEEEKT